MQIHNKLLLRLLSILLLVCLLAPAALAQLYPGDANNDGRVNNVDILYIGYAYGTYGPTRPNTSVEFSEVDVPLFWTQLFPDSTNFAFSDADGSGLIDFFDFLAVRFNYGNKRFNPQLPSYLTGVPNVHPQLRLGKPVGDVFLTEGDTVTLPIFLEGPVGKVLEDVNGIAFSLEFDRRFFKAARIDFDSSWLNRANDLFQFQIPTNNRLEVALTRFGANPAKGGGKIGTFKGIVEDDLIEFLTRDSVSVPIRTTFIKLLNGTFQEIPTAGSEVSIVIFEPNAIVDTDEIPQQPIVQLFPNPSSGSIQIRSQQAIQAVEIFNELGQRLSHWQLDGAYTLGLSLTNPTRGILFVKIYTEKGIIIQKVIIQP